MKAFWMVVFLVTATCEIVHAQTTKLFVPETGKTISISFNADPGRHAYFSSFDIPTEDRHFHFSPKEPLSRFPATKEERRQSVFLLDIPGLKIDPSQYFLIGKYGAEAEMHTLLLFISEAGASDADASLVIGFSESGDPYTVLKTGHLDITSLQSLPDGTAQIIGKTTLSQVMAGDGGNGSTKPYATTYDPFSVYIVKPGEKAAYSLEASQRYNQLHYVWAGPHSREDYAVLYNVPGHHRLFGAPAAKLDTYLGGKK